MKKKILIATMLLLGCNCADRDVDNYKMIAELCNHLYDVTDYTANYAAEQIGGVSDECKESAIQHALDVLYYGTCPLDNLGADFFSVPYNGLQECAGEISPMYTGEPKSAGASCEIGFDGGFYWECLSVKDSAMASIAWQKLS
jgi:hypothetical protein